MIIQAEQLATLLKQVNNGYAAKALPKLDKLLAQQPKHPAVLALKAEALRQSGRLAEAIEAFQEAGAKGGGARNWLAAGVLLAAERNTDEAVRCLQTALGEDSDSEVILDALITTLFNANRHSEALEFARRQLLVSSNPQLLSRAALLLQSVDLYEESSAAFKKIVTLSPDDPALVGAALVPARFTCEWEWVESLQQKIGAWYERGNFDAPHEYPLTHLTWCMDEAYNLGVTRDYVKRMVPQVEPRNEPHKAKAVRPQGKRIRVGYVSCDFRNHATMYLMAGIFESHDRDRFEVFAYDYSSFDVSDYRQRFLNAVEHHVEIHSLSDRQAAARIAEDQLDILFDLKLYTGGGRPGIMAYRPAPLQVAYLGYPGSAANADIDYIVSDRFVTPDSSAPFYTEAFCRLPHTYQCNDSRRFLAAYPGTRALHGLPDDKFIFGAFNQSYKVDRTSFAVWMRILNEVPNSVLWMLGQSPAAVEKLSRYAQLAGIAPDRLIFAPFAAPQAHLARLQLADAVLDTLTCNGHTTTSDALWAGIPVITCRGGHFPSRVSESLLNAIDLPELVGANHDDMVRIAKRMGTETDYRLALRNKIAANRTTAPLFDTLRFTQNFETAIELMVQRHDSGAPHGPIDVPDCGSVVRPPADAPKADAIIAEPAPEWQAAFAACPLCDGASATLGFADCSKQDLWHTPLPLSAEWMRCASCDHVYKRHYWTPAGLTEVFRDASARSIADANGIYGARRATWTKVVGKAVTHLGGYPNFINQPSRPVWVDAGCGDGALVMTAADYGFAAVGLDTRLDAVKNVQALGFNAMQHDFITLQFKIVVDVLSLMDVLDHIPYPLEALRKAAQVLRPGGLMVIGMPDLMSSSWKAMDAANANPYWSQMERCHNFSRERIIKLVRASGFEMIDLALSDQQHAHMALYAIRQ